MKTAHESKPLGVWDWNTEIPGLVRHRKSGRYFSRFQINGKRSMKALKTDDFGQAKLKHYELLASAERQRLVGIAVNVGAMNMGGLLDLALTTHADNSELSERTKTCFELSVARLRQHWFACFGRDLESQKPDRIAAAMAEQLANYLHSRAQWRVRNTKRARRGYSAATVNVTLETLHRILRFAKSRGFILAVPFELESELGQGGIRKSEPRTKLDFPSSAKVAEVFHQMRTIRDDLPENQNELREYLVARAHESADLAEFMAYSGARVNEAVTWTWEDERDEFIYLRGTKTESSQNRIVPKLPAMRDLLERMKDRRKATDRKLKGRVFTITQCREALASACKRAGVDRWTHHTLRHLFATKCIEAGVDIPTVARWLGHADGGALAMAVYGHGRHEHALAQAAKVNFGAAERPAA